MNKISGSSIPSIAGLPTETYRGQSQELRYFANGDGFLWKPEENHSGTVFPPPSGLDTTMAVAQNLADISNKHRQPRSFSGLCFSQWDDIQEAFL
jgi:hypothetical protein